MKNPASITLNGSPRSIDLPCSLSDLLENLGFQGKPVVIELNEQAVFPRDYPVTQLDEGARLEIVPLAAGG